MKFCQSINAYENGKGFPDTGHRGSSTAGIANILLLVCVMPPTYKKPKARQQYLLKRQKVQSKVQSKLKKHAASAKAKPGPAFGAKAFPPAKAKPVAPQQPAPTPAAALRNVPEPVDEEKKFPAGYRATLHYNGAGRTVTAAVRYETEKVDPLIKTVHVAPNGEVVHREFIGPAKREAWMDQAGNEYNKNDVKTAQVMPDGTLKPVVIEKTKDIEVDPVDPAVAEDFLPYSYLELWGEGDSDNEGMRKVAADLIKTGKIGAIKQFSHGYGKIYVGFMRPIFAKDGKSFGVEVMLSENKRHRRRWMLVDKAAAAPKAAKAEVPQLW